MGKEFKAILIIIVSVIAYCQIPDVNAQLSPKKPGLLTENTVNLQEIDDSATTLVEYIIYVAYMGAIMTLVCGIVMLLRGLGKPEVGWAMVKSAFGVGAASGAIHIILGVFGQVFT